MRRTLIIPALVCFAAVSARADIYIKAKIHRDPVVAAGRTQPASDSLSEQWIGDGVFAARAEGTTTVIDLRKSLLFVINHAEKSYIETALPLDPAKLGPPEATALASSLTKMTVSVSPTRETKTIGAWTCTAYDVVLNIPVMPMKIRVWATSDVPFDLESYRKNIFANLMRLQLRLDDAAVAEILKVKGLWIRSETWAEMMGAKMHSAAEVVEIGRKAAPASVFAVPPGYKKTDRM